MKKQLKKTKRSECLSLQNKNLEKVNTTKQYKLKVKFVQKPTSQK